MFSSERWLTPCQGAQKGGSLSVNHLLNLLLTLPQTSLHLVDVWKDCVVSETSQFVEGLRPYSLPDGKCALPISRTFLAFPVSGLHNVLQLFFWT